MDKIITPDLMRFIYEQYRLHWEGVHGYEHWVRVRERGLVLAQETGACPTIVSLFAFLHDCARWDDFHDVDHGPRAAALVPGLNGQYFDLSAEQEAILVEAIAGHTVRQWHDDPTIATCWDADRLDLIRLGIRPKPECLSTEAAKRWSLELAASLGGNPPEK